jgi:hypothetical protein
MQYNVNFIDIIQSNINWVEMHFIKLILPV